MTTTMTTSNKCVSCQLAAIRFKAHRTKQRVTLMRGSKFGFGGRFVPVGMRGWDVYVHPHWIDLRDEKWTYAMRKRYWVAWVWQLNDKCECSDL
jgi:hypothetical protein